MWRAWTPQRPEAACFNLETQAASAGLALGCAYSGSDEYEASVIAQRRAGGAYGHNPRDIVVVAAAGVAALLFIIAF